MRPAILVVLLVLSGGVRAAAADPTSPAESITLKWSSPGDDGITGTAHLFDLRMSNDPLTSTNYAGAARITWAPLPGPPGTTARVTISGLSSGQTYYFAVKTKDEAGNWSAMSNVLPVALGAAATPGSTPVLSFSPAAPNPARTSTQFAFSLPVAGRVMIDVYDVSGRRMKRIADGQFPAGPSQARWDLTDDHGRPVPSGMYFARADLGSAEFMKRVLVRR